MKSANRCLSAAAVILALVAASCTHEYRVGDTAVLRGNVVAEPFFGPPNYGEDPQTDQREVAYILRLARPITVVDSSGVRRTAGEIQLIECVHSAVQRPVSVAGELDEGVSGHHRRDFILFCSNHENGHAIEH